MYRHHPQTKRLRQLVDERAIGDVRLVRSCFSYSLYADRRP
jgi:xylose dehydrogenase (NAD/NADP)